MARRESRELLERLLGGEVPTPKTLDDFLRLHVHEDQHVDYKDGKIFDSSKEAAKVLREYMAGFANADGGVLILGVEDKTFRISPCSEKDPPRLYEWAARSLKLLAGRIYPLPSFKAFEHSGGTILIAWTSRSDTLVWYVETGVTVYPFRMGESTVLAPEVVVADLLLGRRQRPRFDLKLLSASFAPSAHPVRSGQFVTSADLTFAVVNSSLVWANDVRVGIVTWSVASGPTKATLPEALAAYIVIGSAGDRSDAELLHQSVPHGYRPSAAAFDRLAPITISGIRLPDKGSQMHWNAAVYVLSRDAPPAWFQLSYNLARESWGNDAGARASNIALPRVVEERPLVSWGKATLDPTVTPM